MESMRKEIGSHEIGKNWNLVRIRELDGKIPSLIYGHSRKIGLHMVGSSNTGLTVIP